MAEKDIKWLEDLYDHLYDVEDRLNMLSLKK